MSIAAKVFDGIAKTIKCLFYVRAPVFTIKIIFEFLPITGITEGLTGRREHKPAFPVQGIKQGKIFPFELIPEYSDGDEKILFRSP